MTRVAKSERRRVAVLAAIACAILVALLMALAAAPAQARVAKNPPNDPEFAKCESMDPITDSTTGCDDGDQWDLFGQQTGSDCPASPAGPKILPHPDNGLPCWSPLARDPNHMAGLNFTGAWDQGNIGRPDVLVAYIEGGVNYSHNNIRDSLDNIYLNRRELPYPERANGKSAGKYDANGDGHFDIRDYANDPRVHDF